MILDNLFGPKKALLDQTLYLKIAQVFVPKLGITRSSYEDEAAAAKKRREDLEAMPSGFEAFTVAPSLTLYTLVSTFIEDGL